MSIFTSLFSKAAGMVTGGVTSYWKYIAIFVVACSVLGGVSLWSYDKGVAKSNAVIANYQLKLSQDETKLSQAVTVIQTQVITKYVTKTVTIHDHAKTNATVINSVVPGISILSSGWISAHNAAAQGLIVDPTLAAVVTPSGVTESQALGVVADNYSTCLAIRENLIALQQLEIQVQQAINNINSNGGKK